MYTYLNEQISLAHKQPIETIALHTGKRENGMKKNKKYLYVYTTTTTAGVALHRMSLKTQQNEKK